MKFPEDKLLIVLKKKEEIDQGERNLFISRDLSQKLNLFQQVKTATLAFSQAEVITLLLDSQKLALLFQVSQMDLHPRSRSSISETQYIQLISSEWWSSTHKYDWNFWTNDF